MIVGLERLKDAMYSEYDIPKNEMVVLDTKVFAGFFDNGSPAIGKVNGRDQVRIMKNNGNRMRIVELIGDGRMRNGVALGGMSKVVPKIFGRYSGSESMVKWNKWYNSLRDGRKNVLYSVPDIGMSQLRKDEMVEDMEAIGVRAFEAFEVYSAMKYGIETMVTDEGRLVKSQAKIVQYFVDKMVGPKRRFSIKYIDEYIADAGLAQLSRI